MSKPCWILEFSNKSLALSNQSPQKATGQHCPISKAVQLSPREQTVTLPDGQSLGFAIDPFRKMCLREGMDDLGYLLSKDAAITVHEAQPAYV